jgi:hypothetical protein
VVTKKIDLALKIKLKFYRLWNFFVILLDKKGNVNIIDYC